MNQILCLILFIIPLYSYSTTEIDVDYRIGIIKKKDSSLDEKNSSLKKLINNFKNQTMTESSFDLIKTYQAFLDSSAKLGVWYKNLPPEEKAVQEVKYNLFQEMVLNFAIKHFSLNLPKLLDPMRMTNNEENKRLQTEIDYLQKQIKQEKEQYKEFEEKGFYRGNPEGEAIAQQSIEDMEKKLKLKKEKLDKLNSSDTPLSILSLILSYKLTALALNSPKFLGLNQDIVDDVFETWKENIGYLTIAKYLSAIYPNENNANLVFFKYMESLSSDEDDEAEACISWIKYLIKHKKERLLRNFLVEIIKKDHEAFIEQINDEESTQKLFYQLIIDAIPKKKGNDQKVLVNFLTQNANDLQNYLQETISQIEDPRDNKHAPLMKALAFSNQVPPDLRLLAIKANMRIGKHDAALETILNNNVKKDIKNIIITQILEQKNLIKLFQQNDRTLAKNLSADGFELCANRLNSYPIKKIRALGLYILRQEIDHGYPKRELIQEYIDRVFATNDPIIYFQAKQIISKTLAEGRFKNYHAEQIVQAIINDQVYEFIPYLEKIIYDSSFAEAVRKQGIRGLLELGAHKFIGKAIKDKKAESFLRIFLLKNIHLMGHGSLTHLAANLKMLEDEQEEENVKKAFEEAINNVGKLSPVPPKPKKVTPKPELNDDPIAFAKHLAELRRAEKEGTYYKIYQTFPQLWHQTMDKLLGGMMSYQMKKIKSEDGDISSFIENMSPEALGAVATKLMKDIQQTYEQEKEIDNRHNKLGSKRNPFKSPIREVDEEWKKKEKRKKEKKKELANKRQNWREMIGEIFEKIEDEDFETWTKFSAHYKGPILSDLSSYRADKKNIWEMDKKLYQTMKEEFEDHAKFICDPNMLFKNKFNPYYYPKGNKPKGYDKIYPPMTLKRREWKISPHISDVLVPQIVKPLEHFEKIFKDLKSKKHFKKKLADYFNQIPKKYMAKDLEYLFDKSLKQLKSSAVKENAIKKLKEKLEVAVQAQHEVQQLFMEYHKTEKLNSENYSPQLPKLMQKWKKKGVPLEISLLTWESIKALFIKKTITECMETHPDGSLENFQISGLQFLLPRNKLISILLEYKFILQWLKERHDEGTGTWEKFKKSKYGDIIPEELLKEVFQTVKAMFLMRDDYINKLGEVLGNMHYIDEVWKQYKENEMIVPKKVEEKRERFYALSAAIKETLNNYMEKYPELKIDFFSSLNADALDNAQEKFKEQMEQLKQKAKDEQENKKTLLKSFEAGVMKLTESVHIVFTSNIIAIKEGRDEAGKFIHDFQNYMNESGYGSILGSSLELSESHMLSVFFKIHPFLQLASCVFGALDQLIDEIELINIQAWMRVDPYIAGKNIETGPGIDRATAKRLIKTNPYLKWGHFFAGVSKVSIGMALSLSGGGPMYGANGTKLIGKELVKAQAKELVKQTVSVGLFSLAGSLGQEFIRLGKTGKEFSYKSIDRVVSGTTEGMKKSMLQAGIISKAASKIGKGAASMSDDIALHSRRARAAAVLDVAEGTTELPRVIENVCDLWDDIWAGKQKNWYQILGVGLSTFVSLWDLGMDNVATGIYNKIQNTKDPSKLSPPSDEELLHLAQKTFGKEFKEGSISREELINKVKAMILILGNSQLTLEQSCQGAADSLRLKKLNPAQKSALKKAKEKKVPGASVMDNILARIDLLTHKAEGAKASPFNSDQASKLVLLGFTGVSGIYGNYNQAFEGMNPREHLIATALIEKEKAEIEANIWERLKTTREETIDEKIVEAQQHGKESELLLATLRKKSDIIDKFFSENTSGILHDLGMALVIHMKKKHLGEGTNKSLSDKELSVLAEKLSGTELLNTIDDIKQVLEESIACSISGLASTNNHNKSMKNKYYICFSL